MRGATIRESTRRTVVAVIALLSGAAAGCPNDSSPAATGAPAATGSPGTAAPTEPPCIGEKDLEGSGSPDRDGNMLAKLLLERCGDRLPMDLTAALEGLASPMGAVDPAIAAEGLRTAFARVCALDEPPVGADSDRVAKLSAIYDACKLEGSGYASRGELLSAPDVARAMLGVALAASLQAAGLVAAPTGGGDASHLARRIALTIARMNASSPRRWADTGFFAHTETEGSPIPSDVPTRTGHVLYLRPDGIDVNDERILTLEKMRIPVSLKKDGVQVSKLFDSLFDADTGARMAATAGSGWAPRPLLVAVDGRMPSRTLMEALITADAAGWQRFVLLPSRFPDLRAPGDVPPAADRFASLALPPSPDRPTPDIASPGPKHVVVERKGPPGDDRLHVHVTHEGIRVRAGTRLLPTMAGCPGEMTWCTLNEATWNGLLAAAMAFKDALPEAEVVQISADPEVPVSMLLRAIAATRFRRETVGSAADAETPRLLPSAILVLKAPR